MIAFLRARDSLESSVYDRLGALLDAGAECVAATPVIRELDRRRTDGIDVRLLWNQNDELVVVAVFDAKTGDAFEIEVEGRETLDAFHHPYAHAAFRGIDYRSSTGERHIPSVH